MAWTKEQQEAITHRGENIIVSAGAGSGKTAVLSERILSYCQNGGDIRRVLVLTFTEAAAGEMKERIRKKLTAAGLSEQAELIDSAYITTFDSYSLSIVKRYYYLLGLEKGVSIMDGALIRIKKREIIRDLFTEYYRNQNPDFYEYLKKYSLQDDKDVLNTVDDLSWDLELIVDLDSFISSYEENYLSMNKIHELSEKYEDLVRGNVAIFLDELRDYVNYARGFEKTEKLIMQIEAFLSHLHIEDSYEILCEELRNYSIPRMPSKVGEDYKAYHAEIKKKLESTQAYFKKYTTKAEMEEEILSTKKDILFLLSMCQETLKRLFDYKKKHNMYGFMDIAKLAIKLVKEDSNVREELKASYDEILVDEYQDTSDIQEAFLSLIENNNRYMVGDIKQSIYRFRNANPYIFKEKYNAYSKGNGGYKIDLTYNFRSRREVLDNINLLFNILMTDSIGDANYKESHQMQYGQENYEQKSQNIDFNTEILSYKEDPDSLFTQAENEAFIMGKDIKERLKKEPLVLHGDTYSSATYHDFCILIAQAKEFLTIKSVFEYLNIPLSIEAALDLKESILPTLYKNILKVMDYTERKEFKQPYYHALASLARSFLYEYKDEDVYQLIYNKKPYGILNDIDEMLSTDEISYSQLFYKIDEVFHIYDKLSKIGDVDSSLVVLEYIHTTFKQFEDLGFTLSQAQEYMETLLSSDVKMEYKPTSSSKDAVRIMTIHKSKGLEFPYVYFPLLTHGFNQADMRANIGLSKNYGIFIPYAEEGKSSTIIRNLYQEEIKIQDISEKVRLLYVALTRAREKMILLLPNRDYKKLPPNKYGSFADMVYNTKSLLCFRKEINLADYDITDYKISLAKPMEFDGQEVLTYKEREANPLLTKTKISKELKKIPDQKLASSIELGLKFHSALESLDFKNPNIDGLPIDSFMKSTLREILSHDIFKNIKDAKTYHENEFYFSDLGEDFHGIIDLLCIYSDHVDIIDYKLSNTESIEYKRQLAIYKRYVETKTNLPIHLYLLSILKKEIKKIEL